jgi:hypothetical protein
MNVKAAVSVSAMNGYFWMDNRRARGKSPAVLLTW